MPPGLPLFYRQVAALSRERHRDWYIDPDQGYRFAAGTNSVYLAASEFAQAAREYAIVFARDRAGEIVPAALLGLRNAENLMVGEDGAWDASYVPAYVRRYPFILARADEQGDQLTVCIDESFSGFNTAREGERLLDEQGEQGELTRRSVRFLQEFHRHTRMTARFCAALEKHDLLDDIQVNIEPAAGEKLSLTGFRCVTRDKLGALPAEKLKALLEASFLDLIFFHMHSLVNLDKLLQRMGRAPAGAPSARASAAS